MKVKPKEDDQPIDDSFKDEQLFTVSTTSTPWYADFVNYLACGIMPPEFTYQQRKKFLSDVKSYFWDYPILFKLGVDGIHRRCVPNEEYEQIIRCCHSSAYGGHTATEKTARKVLQAGFYWPTLFKDTREFVLKCDKCQRSGNISRRD